MNKLENNIKMSLADMHAKDAEIRKKQSEIQEFKINQQWEDQQRRIKEIESSKNINLDEVPETYYDELEKENEEYLRLAKDALTFVNPDFDRIVPFFAKNLIFIGAQSGHGKSSITANIALSTIIQPKAGKILIITNEERDTDVFNRITCLIKGWAYVNHNKFDEEQRETFRKYYKILGEKIRVVSDSFNGMVGVTTTLEGVKNVLNSVLTGKTEYSAIIIDYFQNISISNSNPSMEEYKVLDSMATYLDSFMKRSNSPIIVLGQLKNKTDKEETPFKMRIERCKSIYNRASCALEMRADHQNRKTDFIVHKGRFSEMIGQTVSVGYDKGKFVKYDKQFKDEVNQRKLKETLEKDRQEHIDLLKMSEARNEQRETVD